MLLQQVALVSEVQGITARELTKVGAAIQKQAIRDFAPIWGAQATVDPFLNLDDVPIGYWPVIIRDDIKVNALGVHRDKDGQPFALVRFNEGWPLTTSHETMEMLGDPFGNRLIAGQSKISTQGRVEYLVEVCDPSEASDYAYTVNGIAVSDFYTPNYFDPVKAVGVRYSFTGALTEPRQVLPGGYLSWHDPVSDHWFQENYLGPQPTFPDLGTFSGTQSLRAFIDSKTKTPLTADKPPKKTVDQLTAMTAAAAPEQATNAKAKSLREQIEELKKMQ